MRVEVVVSIFNAITSEKRKESAFQQLPTAQIPEFCSSFEQLCDRTQIKFFKVSLFSPQVSTDYITVSGKYLLTSLLASLSWEAGLRISISCLSIQVSLKEERKSGKCVKWIYLIIIEKFWQWKTTKSHWTLQRKWSSASLLLPYFTEDPHLVEKKTEVCKEG